MQLLVNHLTRMQRGYLCIAGLKLHLDAQGNTTLAQPIEHVRPVVRGRLSTKLLRRPSGTLALGALISLGSTQPVGRAPEVEDWLFRPNALRIVRQLDERAFWQALQRAAKPRLVDIFGPSLQWQGRSAVVEKDQGQASLGVLKPQGAVTLSVNAESKLRLYLRDGSHSLSLSVTDLRFYQEGQSDWELRRNAVDTVLQAIRHGAEVLLSVGLTRPWQKPGLSKAYHWLQVNNIHLADRPLWQP